MSARYLRNPIRPSSTCTSLKPGWRRRSRSIRIGRRSKLRMSDRKGWSEKPWFWGLTAPPTKTFMQVKGSALRMRAGELTKAMDERPSIRGLLLGYVHTCLIQFAHSALANGRYSIQERLARWLLTCHDRLGRDDLPLTHEFLSLMLGVRRSGVTQALHSLEIEEAIEVKRGQIVVSDRRKLDVLPAVVMACPKPSMSASLLA